MITNDFNDNLGPNFEVDLSKCYFRFFGEYSTIKYNGLLTFIELIQSVKCEPLHFEIDLKMKSARFGDEIVKVLLDLLSQLEKMPNKVMVFWVFGCEDERELGEEFADLLEFDFEYIPRHYL